MLHNVQKLSDFDPNCFALHKLSAGPQKFDFSKHTENRYTLPNRVHFRYTNVMALPIVI